MKRLSLKSQKFKKKKPLSPQSILIDTIFQKHGGIVGVSKKLKVSKQLVFIWRSKGCVPLSRIHSVAEALKVPCVALNFKEYSKFMTERLLWKDVCEKCYSALALLS